MRPLLLVSLALLVPLGALKWRAEWIQEHPPVSKMDKRLQAAANQADTVYITGGYALWRGVTHLPDDKTIIIRDRLMIAQLSKVLRLSDASWPDKNHDEDDNCIDVDVGNSKTHTGAFFSYHHRPDGKGSYIVSFDFTPNHSGEKKSVKVPSRYGPRFEAFVTQLAKRAKAPGEHPEIVLATHGF